MRVTEYNVFGWKIDNSQFEDGEAFETLIPKDVSRQLVVNNTFFTKGLFTGQSSEPNINIEDRVAGFYNTDLPLILKRQKITFVSHGISEFWCLNKVKNGGVVPAINKLILEANTSYVTQNSAILLVCEGSVEVNSATLTKSQFLEVSAGDEVVSTEKTYCLLMS